MSKIRIAVVGCGTRGRHFIETIPQIGENLVALCDVNQQRAAAGDQRCFSQGCFSAHTNGQGHAIAFLDLFG